tara:strand:+ start:51 stop:221 length:171 start_codon:yes stop_codon:yes gene_type:complete
MYIRAKYPKVGNEYGGTQAKPQGFGSLYGGNHASDIANSEREDTIINVNNSTFNAN